MDIIVTTPKSERANAAAEARDCIAAGGGEYFRRFATRVAPRKLAVGDRVYYVEAGFIRGYALVRRIEQRDAPVVCDTSGRAWPPGCYVFMDAASWRWIRPIPMRGCQAFRYAPVGPDGERRAGDARNNLVEEIGGWLDPMPALDTRCQGPAARAEALR